MPGLSVEHGLVPLALMALACDQRPSLDHDVGFAEPRQSGFVPVPDLGGGTVVDCSPFRQDCPSGEKCVPWSEDGGAGASATRCSPVVPDAGVPGDPCTVADSLGSGLDDCERGAMCWHVDWATLEGRCVAQVFGSADIPRCADPTDVPVLSAGQNVTLCLPGCHPFHDDCMPGHGCYPTGERFTCGPDASGDAGDFGDPCEFLNVCRSGLACVSDELVPDCTGLGCCTPYCELDAPVCPIGTTCQPWADDPPPTPHPELVGICAA